MERKTSTKLQKNFGSLRVSLCTFCTSSSPMPLPARTAPGAELRVPISVPSTTVTKKIKKHFLSESRQGGTWPCPCTPEVQERAQPSPTQPCAPTQLCWAGKGHKKKRSNTALAEPNFTFITLIAKKNQPAAREGPGSGMEGEVKWER